MILSKSHIKYTCGLSVFLTIATAQALSADLRSDHDDWVGKPVEVNYYHPLLKVKAGHGLNGKRLDNTTLKALNKYRRPDIRSMPKNIEDPYAWSAYFELAEFEAAKQFCAKINGLSKKQVEEIAGQPTYRGGGLPGWKWLKPKEDVWIYNFGGNWIPAYAVFSDDFCSKSSVCTREEFTLYQDWRIAQLCQFAMGKSYSAIVSTLGLPDFINDNTAMTGSKTIAPKILKNAYYLTSTSQGVELTFDGGHCKKTGSCVIAGGGP